MLKQETIEASETQKQEATHKEDIREIVARIQKEKSDITAHGYQMGKHVDTERRERVKIKLTQTALTERIGYIILAALLLGFVWLRLTARW